MRGLFFLLCCTEILGARVYGTQFSTTDSTPDESSSSSSATISDTFPTSISADTAMSSTQQATKVTTNSRSIAPPHSTQSTLYGSIFGRVDCLPLLMMTGGLMVLCALLLVSTLLLACKVCHLARRIKGLSSNSDLISNTEYWVGTDKKGKSKLETEPKETTVLMADISETPAETGNGTKEEGGKVTEEGQTGEEDKKEVGDATNGKEASAEPVADAEKSSPSKPQEEATDSQITKAETASTSEGTEEPKDVV